MLEKVRIGGSDQWVLERSEDVDNPVVLYLHGGPGTSQLTSNRRNTRHLEKFFTVVNWDQRGAGKSYRAISDAGRMNIGQFVADTRELTLYLLEKFGQERLVLVGHSWGTVIGALTVSAYPELYSCYVGIGQVANMAEGEAASYQWTLGHRPGQEAPEPEGHRGPGDNGAADPQDPPANMSGAQQIWPNSRLLAEPGQSHSMNLQAWLQCDVDLVQAFVERASASGLNTGCLAQVALPPFPAHW